MVAVGVIPFAITQEEPSLVEAKVKDNAPNVDYTKATAAMIANILSDHEMRCMHEMSSPLTRPILRAPVNGADVDSARSLVRKIRKSKQEKKTGHTR
jgi:hypothetical protein